MSLFPTSASVCKVVGILAISMHEPVCNKCYCLRRCVKLAIRIHEPVCNKC